jgi:serine/threonine protein kinase
LALTEKIDVYGLGNVLYYIYTRGRIVYQDVTNIVAARAMVVQRVKPTEHDLHREMLYEKRQKNATNSTHELSTLARSAEVVRNVTASRKFAIAKVHADKNSDPYMKALYDAIMDCHTYSPEERPSAQEVATFLRERISDLDMSSIRI